MFGISRFILIHEVVAAKFVFQALLVDLALAVFIALLANLLHKLHITASALILILISFYHITNMEMAAAIDSKTYIKDGQKIR